MPAHALHPHEPGVPCCLRLLGCGQGLVCCITHPQCLLVLLSLPSAVACAVCASRIHVQDGSHAAD